MTVPVAIGVGTSYAPRGVAIGDPPAGVGIARAPLGVAIGDPPVGVGTAVVPRGIAIDNPPVGIGRAVAPAPRFALPAVLAWQTVYRCILSADGLPDYEVPIKSVQMRRRDGEPTMISVVVPDAMTYLAACEDYRDGYLTVWAGMRAGDGTENLAELERVVLESVAYDHGVQSSSLTLSGYRTQSTANPRTVTVSGGRYYGLQADGRAKIRANVNQWLRPGDTVIYGATQVTVSQIYIMIDHSLSWMEVSG